MILYNQPVLTKFCSSLKCNERTEPCQLANLSDSFLWQIGDLSQQYDDANMVANGDFNGNLNDWTQTNTGADDWVYDSGRAKNSLSGGLGEYIYQDLDLDPCKFYRINFDYQTGTNELEFGTFLNTNTVSVQGQLRGSGSYVFYMAGTYESIYFKPTETGTGDVFIDNVEVYEVNTAAELRDCCDNFIKDLPCEVFQYEYSCGDYFNVKFIWSDYVSGHQKVKVCLPDMEVIPDAKFFDLTWSQGNITDVEWILTKRNAATQLDTNERSRYLFQYVDLPKCAYTLRFTAVTNIENVNMYIYSGDDLLYTQSGNIASAGEDFNINVTTEYNYGEIGIVFESLVDSNDIQISKFSILQDVCTNCFCVGTNDCSNLIESRNNNDYAGLFFQNSEKFSLRIESDPANPAVNMIEEQIESSIGDKRQYYGEFRNLKNLKVFSQPEYIFRALNFMLTCTDVRLNKELIIKEPGNIEVNWDRFTQSGMAEIGYQKKSQYNRNYY